MAVPKDLTSFTDAMADLLRLPDEALAMTYIYLNRYSRFARSSASADPLDSYVCLPMYSWAYNVLHSKCLRLLN